MHEMSICEGILQILEERAVADRFDSIRKVRVEIGRFAGVEVEALRFSFDVVTRNSVAEGAVLEIIDLPGRAYCFNCETDVSVNDRFSPCPHCGSGRLTPTGGDEMRIKDLEVA